MPMPNSRTRWLHFGCTAFLVLPPKKSSSRNVQLPPQPATVFSEAPTMKVFATTLAAAAGATAVSAAGVFNTPIEHVVLLMEEVRRCVRCSSRPFV